MSVTSLSGSLYTIQRVTPFVLDSVVALAGGNAATRQPPVASTIQVKALAGGQVIVTGTSGGSSTTSTLVFAAAGYKTTGKMFTVLTTFTPSGALLGTAIEAKALASDGTPHMKLMANVVTGLPGVFSPASPSYNSEKPRQSEKALAMIGFDYVPSITIKSGDYLLDETTGELWEVIKPNLLRGGQIAHHWEVHVEERSGGSPT